MEKRSKAETEAFYRELVAEHDQSGLTLRAFAEKRGVPSGTLSSWRYQLKTRDAARARESGRAATTSGFVPVRVVDAGPVVASATKAAEPSTSAPRNPAATRGGYEIVLGSDRVLRLPADFDEARVAALVRAVALC
jgi:transposase-like protein